MLINLKAQVEVKVRSGTKETVGQVMIDQLASDLNQLLVDFLSSRGQNPALYRFLVSEGNQLMKT
jgi:hypothetical protein